MVRFRPASDKRSGELRQPDFPAILQLILKPGKHGNLADSPPATD